VVGTGDLQGPTDDLGLYRRAEIADFVTWARATVIRLQDHAERSLARAVHAEARLAAALERAELAEARAARAESECVENQRALQRRDHDMEAVLGKAMLLAQHAADDVAARATEAVARVQAEMDRVRAEADEREAAPAVPASGAREWVTEEPAERVIGLWATDDDDSLFGPLRAVQARGA